MAGVASVSTGLTMMASTPCAMKFWIWLSCLATSFCASSTCRRTPSSVRACSSMPLRSTVRKLSSKSAIETPIRSAGVAHAPSTETARASRSPCRTSGRLGYESSGDELHARRDGGAWVAQPVDLVRERLEGERSGVAAGHQGADLADRPETITRIHEHTMGIAHLGD